MLKEMGAHLGQHTAHSSAFHLEDATHFTAREQFERLPCHFTFKGDGCQGVLDAVPFFDQPPSLAHHRKRTQAEKVHLEQPNRLQDRKLKLGHRVGNTPLAGPHERGIVDQFLVRHNHRGGVDAGVTRHPFQFHRIVEQTGDPRLILIKLHQFGVVKLMALGHHIFDQHRFAGDGRDQLGNAIDLGQRDLLGATDIFNRRTRLHAPEGDNLRHLLLAILFNGVADHLFALVIGEIQVEIGHGNTGRVEEALKDQVVLERIDAGDAGAVGDQ